MNMHNPNEHRRYQFAFGSFSAKRFRFEGVSLQVAGDQILKDVSFSVRAGEVITLLGQSGAGKTTLLRIAAGIETPTAGTVLIDDRIVAGESVFVSPEARNVGLMFQDYALFPHLSILKNVMFGLKKLPRGKAESEAREALERVGLGDYAAHFPHMLSGGQQQRVALARALAPKPKIILMDEPFSGLDKRLRDRVRDETLSLLREMGATCVIVTHDPEEAMHVSDRILLLRDGAIIQYDTPDGLYHRPVDYWAAHFFSELNEIDGVFRNGQVHTEIGEFPGVGFVEGQALQVCIRHQGLKLHKKDAPQSTGTIAPIRSGLVRRRLFLGEHDMYELALEGCAKAFFARAHGGESFEPGENISVSISKKDTLIFAK